MLNKMLNRIMSNVECCTTNNINIIVPGMPVNGDVEHDIRVHTVAKLIALYVQLKYNYQTTECNVFNNSASDIEIIESMGHKVPNYRKDVIIGVPWMNNHPNYISVTDNDVFNLWLEICPTVSPNIAHALKGKNGLITLAKHFIGNRLITCLNDPQYYKYVDENTETTLKGWHAVMLGYTDVSQLTQ